MGFFQEAEKFAGFIKPRPVASLIATKSKGLWAGDLVPALLGNFTAAVLPGKSDYSLRLAFAARTHSGFERASHIIGKLSSNEQKNFYGIYNSLKNVPLDRVQNDYNRLNAARGWSRSTGLSYTAVNHINIKYSSLQKEEIRSVFRHENIHSMHFANQTNPIWKQKLSTTEHLRSIFKKEFTPKTDELMAMAEAAKQPGMLDMIYNLMGRKPPNASLADAVRELNEIAINNSGAVQFKVYQKDINATALTEGKEMAKFQYESERLAYTHMRSQNFIKELEASGIQSPRQAHKELLLRRRAIKAGFLNKEIMSTGQGSNNTTMLNRSLNNPAKGSKKMTSAL